MRVGLVRQMRKTQNISKKIQRKLSICLHQNGVMVFLCFKDRCFLFVFLRLFFARVLRRLFTRLSVTRLSVTRFTPSTFSLHPPLSINPFTLSHPPTSSPPTNTIGIVVCPGYSVFNASRIASPRYVRDVARDPRVDTRPRLDVDTRARFGVKSMAVATSKSGTKWTGGVVLDNSDLSSSQKGQ